MDQSNLVSQILTRAKQMPPDPPPRRTRLQNGWARATQDWHKMHQANARLVIYQGQEWPILHTRNRCNIEYVNFDTAFARYTTSYVLEGFGVGTFHVNSWLCVRWS
jgi:hypothetical protein